MNFHYSQLEATFGTKFIKIRDKKFSANSWRLLHRLCGRDIAAILIMERAFLDAVVTTGGLSDVGKLVSGGVNVLGRMPGLAWNCRPEDF